MSVTLGLFGAVTISRSPSMLAQLFDDTTFQHHGGFFEARYDNSRPFELALNSRTGESLPRRPCHQEMRTDLATNTPIRVSSSAFIAPHRSSASLSDAVKRGVSEFHVLLSITISIMSIPVSIT